MSLQDLNRQERVTSSDVWTKIPDVAWSLYQLPMVPDQVWWVPCINVLSLPFSSDMFLCTSRQSHSRRYEYILLCCAAKC